MKVLQLIDTLEAGGAERMAVNIANAIAERNIDSYLCATRRSGPLESELHPDVTSLILHKKGTIDLKAIHLFCKWVKAEKIDIIHAHSTSIFLAVIARINNRKLKIVWHDHYGLSDELDERPRKALKLLSKKINSVIVVNQQLKNWSIQVLKNKNTHFLNNFAVLRVDTLPQTNLKGNPDKRVLCLANLRHQKNHIALIKAFKKSTVNHPDWTLHLVGKSFNDEYASKIQKTIKELDATEEIYIYGTCTDIRHILEQSSIGILASISEGLPVSLLEYGTMGLPVIVTDVGQCSEVVGNDGVVIYNVENELPSALIRLYENNGEEREKMGSRFRERIIKNYSRQAFVKKLLPIYRSIIS